PLHHSSTLFPYTTLFRSRDSTGKLNFGTWSATRDDSTFQPMNLPDHVPTVDTKYHGVTSVWTNQISDKTVWTTRASLQNFKTLRSEEHTSELQSRSDLVC